jgi:hypothetical protein
MPETSADGQEQNSQGSGTKARKMNPITTLSLSASHHSTRTSKEYSPGTANVSIDANRNEVLFLKNGLRASYLTGRTDMTPYWWTIIARISDAVFP